MRYQKTAVPGQSWEFVCTAMTTNSTGTKERIYILQPEVGDNISIPEDDFHKNYSLLPGKGSSDTEAIKETLNNIRQNSTVRFVALPFFLGASAVMTKAFASSPWSAEPMIPYLGLGLALVGIVFEIVLSRNLICWWKALKPVASAPPWNMILAHRNIVALWSVRIVLFLPYLAMAFYWMFKVSGNTTWAWRTALAGLAIGILVWLTAKPSKPTPQ